MTHATHTGVGGRLIPDGVEPNHAEALQKRFHQGARQRFESHAIQV